MRLCLTLCWLLLVCPGVAARQPVTTVTGIVLDGVTEAPIGGARVAGGSDAAATDADGRFEIVLDGEAASLRFRADGYLETAVEVDRSAAQAALEVRLFPEAFAETVEVVSEMAVQERPSATPVAPEAVFRAPGSIDNVFRTLDTLAGVASTDDFGSRLAVRGGTPDQNLTVMDGIEVHNPYRLFGIASAFNPETVESFELTAGGFGAAYGDRLSSILVVDNRAGRPASRPRPRPASPTPTSSSRGPRRSVRTVRGCSAPGAPTTTSWQGASPTRTSRRSPTCSFRRGGTSGPGTGSP